MLDACLGYFIIELVIRLCGLPWKRKKVAVHTLCLMLDVDPFGIPSVGSPAVNDAAADGDGQSVRGGSSSDRRGSDGGASARQTQRASGVVRNAAAAKATEHSGLVPGPSGLPEVLDGINEFYIAPDAQGLWMVVQGAWTDPLFVCDLIFVCAGITEFVVTLSNGEWHHS